jgi:hypothetical protein
VPAQPGEAILVATAAKCRDRLREGDAPPSEPDYRTLHVSYTIGCPRAKTSACRITRSLPRRALKRTAAASQRDAVHIERDAVHIQRDAVHVERDAVHIQRDAVHIQRDAVHIQRDAVRFERDAVHIQRHLRAAEERNKN